METSDDVEQDELADDVTLRLLYNSELVEDNCDETLSDSEDVEVNQADSNSEEEV